MGSSDKLIGDEGDHNLAKEENNVEGTAGQDTTSTREVCQNNTDSGEVGDKWESSHRDRRILADEMDISRQRERIEYKDQAGNSLVGEKEGQNADSLWVLVVLLL